MLDLLLIPAAILLALALRAVRRGEHRLHGHLMLAAFTVIALRVLLYPRQLAQHHLLAWLSILGAAGITMLAGRAALAWREARSTRAAAPRTHRAFGAVTLVALSLITLWWLLRHRA